MLNTPGYDQSKEVNEVNFDTIPERGVAFFYISSSFLESLDPSVSRCCPELLYIIASDRDTPGKEDLRKLVKDAIRGGVLFSDFKLRLAFFMNIRFWRFNHPHPNMEGFKIDRKHEFLLQEFVNRHIRIGVFEAYDGASLFEPFLNMEPPYFQSPQFEFANRFLEGKARAVFIC